MGSDECEVDVDVDGFDADDPDVACDFSVRFFLISSCAFFTSGVEEIHVNRLQ